MKIQEDLFVQYKKDALEIGHEEAINKMLTTLSNQFAAEHEQIKESLELTMTELSKANTMLTNTPLIFDDYQPISKIIARNIVKLKNVYNTLKFEL